ncbi:MAG: transcription-repair coupling factor, partial [Clostridiales bacterium]|nr:transcription-repair coupling factor [Clostridiales bacterium]
ATQTASDIEGMTGIACHVFSQRSVEIHHVQAASKEVEHRRSALLGDMILKKAKVIIAPIDSLITPLCPVKDFKKAFINIKIGDEISPLDLSKKLTWSLYHRESRVEQVGQFAVRGDIVDIFPVGSEHPIRIEFFGDDIESIRNFDETTQRSLTKIQEIIIYPAMEMPLDITAMERGANIIKSSSKNAEKRAKSIEESSEETHKSDIVAHNARNIDKLVQNGYFEGMENHMRLFYPNACTIDQYLDDPILIFDEITEIKNRSDALNKEYHAVNSSLFKTGHALQELEDLLYTFEQLMDEFSQSFIFTTTAFTTDKLLDYSRTLTFSGSDAMVYRGQFDLLSNDIKTWRREKYKVAILVGTQDRIDRVKETLEQYYITTTPLKKDRAISSGEVALVPLYCAKGFISAVDKFVVLTENELFGRTKRPKKKLHRKKAGEAILNDIKKGDYVVHESHGIGKYDGITRLETLGTKRDYLKLLYLGGDVLYIPTEQMDRVQKYIGADQGKAKLTRLGGKAWENARKKAKGAVADMTEDLIALYAQRNAIKGFQFSIDGEWQRQFEEAFEYQETPDQITSIAEIKEDMQSHEVMDRLLCGDVGYGKTEVALRAAFKAIADKKQVAILCPTTILCHQHYMTICERFKDFPIEKRELSRFVTTAHQNDTIDKLKVGKVDIVVGTHRLLSKDINFKDLGLLVIDEEQRFGVSHKEKIKKLRVGVDVLTMTATPIPRTLHMSLSGIRDISMIETPPEERFPVQTFVTEYDEEMVKGALEREISRGGQVFFVYNRVQSIDMMKRKINELLPNIKIAIAHGQMPSNQLENVMLDFLEKKYDVLLSTTIIENGLDIPNVNTLIVYDTDKFGLSQLYQLRGRVGRSNRLSYAYLTWRPSNMLTETARKRLEAIAQFTEFGSGLKIAMRDLEIRGAGSLLGAKQHGHMAAIGYGLYCKLIEDAVGKIKGEEPQEAVNEVTLNVQMDAFIPDEYIIDIQDRLDMYRAISYITSLKDKSDIISDMTDRFGEVPQSVTNLMDVAFLKYKSSKVQIKMISQRADKFVLRFEDEINYDMLQLVQYINKNHARFSGQDNPQIFLPISDQGIAHLIDFVLGLVKLRLTH